MLIIPITLSLFIFCCCWWHKMKASYKYTTLIVIEELNTFGVSNSRNIFRSFYVNNLNYLFVCLLMVFANIHFILVLGCGQFNHAPTALSMCNMWVWGDACVVWTRCTFLMALKYSLGFTVLVLVYMVLTVEEMVQCFISQAVGEMFFHIWVVWSIRCYLSSFSCCVSWDFVHNDTFAHVLYFLLSYCIGLSCFVRDRVLTYIQKSPIQILQ